MSAAQPPEEALQEFVAGVVAATVLDKIYVSFDKNWIDPTPEAVEAIVGRKGAGQLTLILKSETSQKEFEGAFPGGKVKFLKSGPKWYPVLVDNPGTHLVKGSIQERFKDQEAGPVLFLASIRHLLRQANQPGILRDLMVKKFGLKADEHLVYRYSEIVLPDPNFKGTFTFLKAAAAGILNGKPDAQTGKKWIYLKDSDFLVTDVQRHSAILGEEIPATKGETAPTKPPSERAQKIPVGEESPFRFEAAKPAAVKAGSQDMEVQKKKWLEEIVNDAFEKIMEYYAKSESNRARIVSSLQIAAGQAAPSEKSVKKGNIFNIVTYRLLIANNQNGGMVIGYVKGDPIFPGATVGLAIDAKDKMVRWFQASDGYEGVNTNRTAKNSELSGWLRETVMPAFWKKFASSVRSSFEGIQEPAEAVEVVSSSERMEKATEGFAKEKGKAGTASTPAFKKTSQPTQEMGFTPAWAASLPILAGEEEDIVFGNIKDLRAQSLVVAQQVLRMDAGDAQRLEVIKKSVQELFASETPKTIDAIRASLQADTEPVQVSTKGIPLQVPVKAPEEKEMPESRGWEEESSPREMEGEVLEEEEED
jgi:hypothetical protein